MSTRSAGRVAVVDDEENIRETVGYALKREGYRVDLYPDGQAAWEKFAQGFRILVPTVMPAWTVSSCRRSAE
jgi:DNA-binding response OmpR family regulator